MFGQFVQLPLTRMSLQGIVLIAQASGEINVYNAASGCQVAGNFGLDFPFDVKNDLAAVKVDNLAEFRAGFAATGGAEFNDVAKFNPFLRGFDGVHLAIVPL